MSPAKWPLVRFTLYAAGGLAVLTALLWIAAAADVRLSSWLPREERAMTGVGFLVVAVAAWVTGLATPLQGFAAAVIATVLHMALYYLPLAYLLELPVNRYSLAHLGTIAGGLFVGYAVALAAVLLVRSLRNTGDLA